ncbi:bifunctional diaminohydroxyphosphoribosylaminopyrimidine deaminase/5-amino-6-(5-phosphoribosylamino)uracil reductase RibD [Sphingomonas sp. MA1305]|uniref:bifunctional diaminohydroxyphosphoribosylaminopyrimidine deaminase/5-amino-6-(5-phosphoribosylamino)uracil reductase RibD n=1 Tax=Sphingomonas sp. MA1305 TaxID=2479204 RepID=UPI001E49F7B1|nr:bifunctional diaminohydroxyphosphoribosylaminopyrimidine deaminase/5-amino-6-(5-phosphoribosylamino)uracil reductase RibD [Sphingomonas sp. MA1305]
MGAVTGGATVAADDGRWMEAALTLATRTQGRTTPNPNVGCVIVRHGRVVGRGWTQPGGRPHAEAMALAEAGAAARGATAYVTLEPCAHASTRGPACADLLVAAGVARVVAALHDPDPRTDGSGFARLAAAGIAVATGVRAEEAARSMAGFLTRRRLGRPFVTLKLATSLDGRIALADGTSRWITGPEARAHAHLERSRHGAILVGRGTWEVDRPALDVRLAGLEPRSPMRVVLSSTVIPADARTHGHDAAGGGSAPLSMGPGLRRDDEEGDWRVIPSPAAIADLPVDHLLVEGGAGAAAAFLAADLVDRLLLYRAPVVIGAGLPSVGDIGLTDLAAAHGRWRLDDARALGSDRLEVYEREPCSPA